MHAPAESGDDVDGPQLPGPPAPSSSSTLGDGETEPVNSHAPGVNGYPPTVNGHTPGVNGYASGVNGHAPEMNDHRLNGGGMSESNALEGVEGAKASPGFGMAS